MNGNSLALRIAIFLGGLLVFLPFLGASHLFDWDEINFAECAREMIETGNYSTVMINYESFWEKPPLFFWLQVISMKIFGINEFAARFPNALAGAFTLLFIFHVGSKIFDTRFGLWWTFLYAASLLPHFYFKSGIIDPWFNLFIFGGVVYFFSASRDNNKLSSGNISLLISGIFLGLATLTKGPVALLIFGLTFIVVWILNRFTLRITFKSLMFFALITLLTAFSWFGIEALSGNSATVVDFIEYQIRLFNTQDAGHGGPFFYHFIVLFFGCFPATVPAIAGIRILHGDERSKIEFHRWMLVLFWVVLILFSIVRTKIVHYSSLTYFPLTFLAAYFLVKSFYRPGTYWKKWMSFLFLLSGIGFALGLILLPLVAMNTDWLLDLKLLKDPFAEAALKAETHWSYFDIIPGAALLIVLLVTTFGLLRKNTQLAYVIICITTLFTLMIATVLFVPRVERFSQGAAIDFYKALQGKENVIAHPVGFKSYAHLFYTHRPPPSFGKAYPDDPLTQQTDLTVFAVSKIQDSTKVAEAYPNLKSLYSKNGFVFWYRTDSGS